MKTNGRSHAATKTPASNMGGGVAGLLHDLMTLAELQVKLFSVDAKDATGRMIIPIGLIAAGAILALTALPLALIAIAQVLRYQADWPPAVATLVALLIGLVIAGILAFVGYLLLRRSLRPMERSREELQRNINWLKGAVQRYDNRQEMPAVPVGYPDRPR